MEHIVLEKMSHMVDYLLRKNVMDSLLWENDQLIPFSSSVTEPVCKVNLTKNVQANNYHPH